MTNPREQRRTNRRRRIVARIRGTAIRPRLAVFRSNKHLYAQIINDDKGVTLVTSSDEAVKKGGPEAIGADLAKKAKTKGVEKVVFDRSGYQYTGVIKKLADGARAGGLSF